MTGELRLLSSRFQPSSCHWVKFNKEAFLRENNGVFRRLGSLFRLFSSQTLIVFLLAFPYFFTHLLAIVIGFI